MPIPITAIVTAFRRIEQSLTTIRILRECQPPPDEIIVHVDGNELKTADAIRMQFLDVQVHVNVDNVGPGGARNFMIRYARNELIASFDDDSYPIDADYFARVAVLAEQLPSAAVLTAAVVHRGEAVPPAEKVGCWVSAFAGGACVYRRSAFLGTTGYVPLPLGYGMEEVYLALRLHDGGWRIMLTPWLRVFHDTDLSHHASPKVTAASISNVALHAYLRYPRRYWLLGAGQVLSRVRWLLKAGRQRGVVFGLLSIPRHLWRYRPYRARVKVSTLRMSRQLRLGNEHVSLYVR